jgi:hypothetical protein
MLPSAEIFGCAQIVISVAGTEPASETMALHIYGLVTFPSPFDLKPDRFVTPSVAVASTAPSRRLVAPAG